MSVGLESGQDVVGPTAIRVGLLLDGTGVPGRRNCVVRLEDGFITAIEDADDRSGPNPPNTVDAQADTLTPGLIDAHVHCAWGLAGQSGWSSAATSPEGRALWAIGSLQAALTAGITTVRDCGCADLTTLHVRDAIQSGNIAGPRVVACGPAITTTAGHGDFIGVTADSEGELVTAVRRLASAGVDFIKVMASGGDMDPHTNRRRPQYSQSQLAALTEDAHRLSLPVVAHCNPTSSIAMAVEAGIDTIAHCNWLGADDGVVEYDSAIADRMLAAGTFIDLNVEATLRPLSEYDGKREIQAPTRAANRWELHADLRRRGARVMLTSDEFGPRIGLFPGLLADVVTLGGGEIGDVISRATAIPGAALCKQQELGVIRPGCRADLALFAGDLEHDPTALTNCKMVWRSGRLVAQGGRLISNRSA